MTAALAQEHLAAGRVREALAALQAAVRTKPADAKLRVFLFQLLCVLGQWPRAATQLEVCGELDAATLAMVNTYREALKCELVREAVFAGRTTPMVFGEPQPWVAWLVEALQADARGERAVAGKLRREALEMAPASAGSANGQPFDWIADADSRLGPVLEAMVNGRYCWIPFGALAAVHLQAPEDLRDVVWTPAQLEFPNGGNAIALIPTRYGYAGGGTPDGANEAELLARRTEWDELAPEQYAGRGQRVFATSAQDIGLLELRELAIAASST
ncbi:MAG TPA: type VI secretion system accessory protein TagJ [Burkholderiaceae bacterium]